jgi:predicted nucleic acid-binding protein
MKIAGILAVTNRQAIAPTEVLAETLNRIGNNIGRQQARLAGKALLARQASGDLLIQQTDSALMAAALDRMEDVRESKGKRVSFVDCLVMAYADFYHTREVFGFDEAFSLNDYQLPGDEAEPEAR